MKLIFSKQLLPIVPYSRIMDTDFAKEQSNSIRLQILQQTATAALSQANMGPQAVLGFLGSIFIIHLLRQK